jgi:hypothetical protein
MTGDCYPCHWIPAFAAMTVDWYFHFSLHVCIKPARTACVGELAIIIKNDPLAFKGKPSEHTPAFFYKIGFDFTDLINSISTIFKVRFNFSGMRGGDLI